MTRFKLASLACFVFAAVLVVVGIIAVAVDATSAADRRACLEEALTAAPTWPGPGPVLDGVDACDGLSTAEKTELRQLLAGVGAQVGLGLYQ